jgi:hypothetical protein
MVPNDRVVELQAEWADVDERRATS